MEIIKNIFIVASNEFNDLMNDVDEVLRVEDKQERMTKGMQLTFQLNEREDDTLIYKVIRDALVNNLTPCLLIESLDERNEKLAKSLIAHVGECIISDESGELLDFVKDALMSKISVIVENDNLDVFNDASPINMDAFQKGMDIAREVKSEHET